MQDTTHTNYSCLFTLQADLVDEVCAHVDLRQIMSTVRRVHHISFPENYGITGLEEGKEIKYHWSGSRSYRCARETGSG